MLSILVADDHALVRKGLREVLRAMSLPCVVIEATTGIEALALGMSQDWDIIILDITLPGLSGLEVLKRVKQARPQVRVLMLSMHSSAPYIERALRDGASGYLTKESAPEELVAAIHAALAGETYLGHDLNKRP